MNKTSNPLRKTRIIIASIFYTGITLLFLDVTGCIHLWLGWMAKIQFLPAVLAANTIVIAGLLLMTLLFGRVYCSVICPLGIMQDIISWAHGKVHKKYKYRFGHEPQKKWLRYGFLVLFLICLILGIHVIVGILAPYSSYGRIVENLFAPIYGAGNNLLARISGRLDSYTFYSTDVWIKSIPTFAIAAVMFIGIGITAWKRGRLWCNSVCPVGTILGFFSKYSIFAIKIDPNKCRCCGLCGRGCKSSCIDMDKREVDYSRCVACMDCIDSCREGAISYRFRYSVQDNMKSYQAKAVKTPRQLTTQDIKDKAATNTHSKNETEKAVPNTNKCQKVKEDESPDKGRRAFLVSSAILGATAANAQMNNIKERLAPERKHIATKRQTRIVPAGAISLRNFETHCTACQLCVNTCPNNVLRASSSLKNLMQPEMSFEKGYCRPECTKCSEVCPAGAIIRITPEEKSSIQTGHAVVNLDLCVVNTDLVRCGNCAKHCPSGAIRMVAKEATDPKGLRIPSVNESACIGCGACENLCPASPIPAIHIEGHEVHRNI